MFPEYFEVLRAIAQPIRAADLPHTLAHIHQLLAGLDNPQQHFRAVVVAGSTGKGTTCLRLAQLLSATGLKVGLYTSPHLHLFRERIAILTPTPDSADSVGAQHRHPIDASALQIISQEEFVNAVRPVLAAQQTLTTRYSTFETTTALALYWFAQQNIDIAVLEVGIGGRFDAVNAVANDLAVFTPIEAEHVAMLGGSLESVAWHKAGIIQPNGTAISVNQSATVAAVLEREAAAKSAAMHFVLGALDHDMHRPPPTTSLITHNFGDHRSHALITSSLPARLERLTVDGHPVIIDGGHTPASARHLRQHIGDTPFRLIVGMLRDKDVAAYLSVFDVPNAHFVYTTAPGDRALSADELLAQYVPKTATIALVPLLNDALTLQNSNAQMITIITGSLRMAAAAREAYGLLSEEDLAESRLTRAIFEGSSYQSKLT